MEGDIQDSTMLRDEMWFVVEKIKVGGVDLPRPRRRFLLRGFGGYSLVNKLTSEIIKLLLVQGFCKQVRYLRIRVTILELYGFIQHQFLQET